MIAVHRGHGQRHGRQVGRADVHRDPVAVHAAVAGSKGSAGGKRRPQLLDHGVDQAIEASIQQVYTALNEHFLKYPYLLGGTPSLADYGLMGPLYAHHGRDPVSANAIKEQAPALYRWIETMQRPPVMDPEVWQIPPEYFSIDELPDTLIKLLRLVGESFVPEVIGTIELYHQWLDTQDQGAGAVIDVEGQKRCHQILGQFEHPQMGATISRIALLDDVGHHQRFLSQLDKLNAAEKEKLTEILKSVGAQDLLNLELKRKLKRENYASVLA